MRTLTINVIVFTMLGPLMVPALCLIWKSLNSSFNIPGAGTWILWGVIFYVLGIIPAYLTGAVSGALYEKLNLKNKWFVVAVNTIGNVIVGGALSFFTVYCIGLFLFSNNHAESYFLAELAAIAGACSSFFCSILVAYLYIRNKNRVVSLQ